MSDRRITTITIGALLGIATVAAVAPRAGAQAPPSIAEIQGAGHLSPFSGQVVSGVEGVVTARRTAGGRGFWIQDPTPDADPST
ncbi:MAG TPA: hypothetical protein VG478_13735, partial [Acidimicrobiales bacterium]|nr:hypothetical protein [Acidimicrobiales bacterium]